MKYYKYFGTDGIRGRVGYFPITPNFFFRIGWVLGKVLSRCSGSEQSCLVILGKDTRISGNILESALTAGLSASGVFTILTGLISTPAIAYFTRIFKAKVGIIISASHNPFYDNGIKFFSIMGSKLDFELERSIEIELNRYLSYGVINNAKVLGKVSRIIGAVEQYIKFCKSTFPPHFSLSKLKIIIDCANGATYHIAPNVFKELGANVIVIACNPDGMNINKECGTTDIRQLRAQVLSKKADVGIAYDGDGDRVTMVDHCGNKIDGDQILYIIARSKLCQGQLIGGVVGTLMSNIGLVQALSNLNIPFIRANVGDRHVLNMLQKKGWYIGGENSGHIILLDKITSGDGIVVALQVLSAMIDTGLSLNELCSDIYLFPQVLINVYYSGCINILESNNIKSVIRIIKQELSDQGRMLLRKSGTEPYIRIMIEGLDYSKILFLSNRVASAIKSEIELIK